MALSEALIAELKHEAPSTRRLLERIPEDKLSWSPHSKSMTLGQLAFHVAVLPGAIAEFLNQPVSPSFEGGLPQAESRDQLLAMHDEGFEKAVNILKDWDNGFLNSEWKMMDGDQTLMAAPRIAAVRNIMMNHVYHHRGQLTVYLRLLDVPLPSVYGPTADESAAM